MKRITAMLAGMALATGVLTVSNGATVPAEASTPNCQHSLGNGTVRSAGYVYPTFITAPKDPVGAVQLCKDRSSRYWGYVVMYKPLSRGRWANVYIDTYYNGKARGEYSCDARGGNHHILAGQTKCWTPKIYGAGSRWTYYVWAKAYTRLSPASVWDDYAAGETLFTTR